MENFIISWGTGQMILNLDCYFKRNAKGRFENTTKVKVNKVMKLVHQCCDDGQVRNLMSWLKSHACKDIALEYEKKWGVR